MEATPTRQPALESRPWRWPVLRAREALALLGFGVAVGLWLGSTVWLTMRADGSTVPWTRPFLWELTGALAAFPLLPMVQTAILNAPSPRASGRSRGAAWGRFLGIHLGTWLLYTSLHILLMVGSRNLLYALLGWGSYDYGHLGFRVPMEAQKDLIVYVLAYAGLTVYAAWKERQENALREARLEGQLKAAQLRTLMGQLNPHFLFNALNTISSVMYEDLAKTDRLLSDLGLLLRESLERGTGPTWPLADERKHTERFLALMQARFGERLRVRWELEPGLEPLPVPRFALQLLVENALKHNQEQLTGLEVRLRAWSEGGALLLEVEDTGRGLARPSLATHGAGLGLTGLRQALELLHGPEGHLELGAGPEGGARVRIRVPVTRARSEEALP
ncbi:sensor histidine kinase [Cystobacter fuscus]|uniref:histidine kinase n=1 Tax=Cystobacter fuscus TaxID=43 RepID=A0A250JE97_9BACT|nr:histidine kinase [Cystobacter fuscus]ATB42209.1 histidine kinase [Cystobacter fuscus]WNG14093.1 sensor histidine kinase [Cystobacter fuscus]